MLTAVFPEQRDLFEAYRLRLHETLGDAIDGTVVIMAELRDRGFRLLALSTWSAETFPVARQR